MSPGEFLDLVSLVVLSSEGTVTSWIRSRGRNDEVGGHPRSLHLVGMAVDVVFENDAEKKRAAVVADRLGLRVIDEGDHLHLQV